MKISIITPSYNQGKYIEKTITSVLSQSYKDVEHIIVDGKSTDDTVKILKKYSSKIKWISEKDKGPADAINKGIKISTGDILCFLNSDDMLEKGVLAYIADYFKNYPDRMWLTGNYYIINSKGKRIRSFISLYKTFFRLMPFKRTLLLTNFIIQPSTFIRKEIVGEIGLIDYNLKYALEYEYWLRIISKYPLFTTNKKLSSFRVHPESMGGTVYNRLFSFSIKIVKKYTNNPLIIIFNIVHYKLVGIVYSLIKY